MPNPYKKKNSTDNPEAGQKPKPKTTSGTKTQVLGQAYIGLGPDAKQKVFYNLSSEGYLEYNILPSENRQIPCLKITQAGHTPVYTTDYYYTNIICATENKDTASQQGAAATQFTFAEDPLEEGETRISAEQLHKQNIPQLDLRNMNITSLKDSKLLLKASSYVNVTKKLKRKPMAEKTPNKLQKPILTDSESSDEDTTPPHFKTTTEEREYGTVPGSVAATTAALSYTQAQCNPTVERGPDKKRRTKVKKLSKEKAADKQTQTSKPEEKK